MQTAHSAVAGGDRAADARLQAAIERARRSEFYARHLAGHAVEGRGDLATLPLTFRHHLQVASPYGMLTVPPTKAWHYHETSGTTGQPISTWCGLPELRAMAAIVHRMVPELAGDTMFLNRFPLFAPVSFVFEEALRLAGACHIAAGNMSWDVPFDRALDFIRRLRVTALACLPLEPILLRELAREIGVDLRRDCASVKVIFAGGAALPPAMRRVIEDDWNARVVEIYGSNETMLMGVSCSAGRLHLCTELLEVEALDPRALTPVPAGERGVLTVTSLVHEVMPLVRYVTGDLVRLDADPCRCGQAGVSAQVLGRVDDIILLPAHPEEAPQRGAVSKGHPEEARSAVAKGEGGATAFDVLDAAYEFAAGLGTRVFFIVVRRRGLHLLVEVAEPGSAPDVGAEQALARRIGLPVTVEYLRHNDVMDRSALFRTPKIYKPTQISDWRGDGRKCITIMEALLEWPRFDARTLMQIGAREWRNRRRRRRIVKEDRR